MEAALIDNLRVGYRYSEDRAQQEELDRRDCAEIEGRAARRAVIAAWLNGNAEAAISSFDDNGKHTRVPVIEIVSNELCAVPDNPIFEAFALIGLLAKGDADYETRKELHLRASALIARIADEHGKLVEEKLLEAA